MTVAVTGATGYLGTHMLLALKDRGETSIAIDDSGSLPSALADVPFAQIDRHDAGRYADFFTEHGVTSVVHFSAHGTVAGSLVDPLQEYERTLAVTLSVLKAAGQTRVEQFVFSSTASVYGVPDRMPINEDVGVNSISPFGAAMAMAERIVVDVCKPTCISTAILRYFNVAGADPKLRSGERGPPRHLIKAAAQISAGILKEPLKIYGDDYNTPDGTAIRDYIHVSDMADAHAVALDYLIAGGDSVILNCGYGQGASVREVIEAVERVTGHEMDTMVAPRRPGDPPILIADTAAIRTSLGWTPRYDNIDQIVRSAIAWEKRNEAE